MRPEPLTVEELLLEAAAGLPGEDAPAEARLLLSRTLGKPAVELFLSRRSPVGAREARKFRRLVSERAGGRPVPYVLGEASFMGLDFKTDSRALCPRPETELLVETALSILRRGRPPEGFGEPPRPERRPAGPGSPRSRVLDLGTGSGAVAVALAAFQSPLDLIATDVSRPALALGRENARRCGVSDRIRFAAGDLFKPLAGEPPFDLIVSNPPYVASSDRGRLAPEVLSEPWIALDGGPDGLAFYRRIIPEAPQGLAPGGWLVFEVGDGQAAEVARLMGERGFNPPRILKDFSGIDRVVAASFGKSQP